MAFIVTATSVGAASLVLARPRRSRRVSCNAAPLGQPSGDRSKEELSPGVRVPRHTLACLCVALPFTPCDSYLLHRRDCRLLRSKLRLPSWIFLSSRRSMGHKQVRESFFAFLLYRSILLTHSVLLAEATRQNMEEVRNLAAGDTDAEWKTARSKGIVGDFVSLFGGATAPPQTRMRQRGQQNEMPAVSKGTGRPGCL